MIHKISAMSKVMQTRFQSGIILALLFATIIIWQGAAQGKLVINGVEANPAGDEMEEIPIARMTGSSLPVAEDFDGIRGVAGAGLG
jgi:hypothetical protein